MQERYGPKLRRKRIEAGYGLREFADLIGVKASNLSNIENEKVAPFFDMDRHVEILTYLEVEPHSKEWYSFFDAAKRRQQFPKDVESPKHEEAIVTLLRTVGRKQLSEDEILKLNDYINKEWNAANDV